MGKCYFCKKRVWFWQDEFWSYHVECYRDHVRKFFEEGTKYPEDSGVRSAMIREARWLDRNVPRLKLWQIIPLR